MTRIKQIMLVGIVLLLVKVQACSSANQEQTELANRVLFVVSNADTYGDSDISAANHFAEIILPYDEFVKEGYTVDFVSPEGGAITIGYIDTTYAIQKKYLSDEGFRSLLRSTSTPSQIESSNYAAIYYVGGGAAMYGVPENKIIQSIAAEIYEKQNGVVSALCHGSAGLVNIKLSDGQFLVKNKKVNGYPDLFEDMEAPYYQNFPFSIEQKLMERGGVFEYSEEGWDDYSIADDRLITGQDPTAARSVAKKVIERLNN